MNSMEDKMFDAATEAAHDLAREIFLLLVQAEDETKFDWETFSALSHVAMINAMALNMVSMGLQRDVIDLFLDETRNDVESYYKQLKGSFPSFEAEMLQ